MSSLHLVVPGQVIASSAASNNDGEGGGGTGDGDASTFLRGHGTYLENNVVNPTTGQLEQRLIASVCGMVQRVNQLITVVPCAASMYNGNVGDLVVGKITSVGTNRWKVQLTLGGTTSRDAHLPLAGVHLPGGVQRIRTVQDQREMRHYLKEGDWVSAEVHKVQQQDGTLLLHTRSTRYGKLDYGSTVVVPPALIPRRKNHYMTDYMGLVDIVWGTNGIIWIQRKMSSLQSAQQKSSDVLLQQRGDENRHEVLRKEHSTTPLLKDDRVAIARVRNSILCLSLVHAMITPEDVESIYKKSLTHNLRPADMLHPDWIIQLTAPTRK